MNFVMVMAALNIVVIWASHKNIGKSKTNKQQTNKNTGITFKVNYIL